MVHRIIMIGLESPASRIASWSANHPNRVAQLRHSARHPYHSPTSTVVPEKATVFASAVRPVTNGNILERLATGFSSITTTIASVPHHLAAANIFDVHLNFIHVVVCVWRRRQR